MKRTQLLFLFLCISFLGFSQSGGGNTYDFLTLNNSARHGALGSNFLSVNDDDINLAITNPSLISDYVHNSVSISVVDFYSDISYGFASYGRTFEKYGNFVASMQYVNYGTIEGYNSQGIETGDISAGEYALNIGWGRPLTEKFTLGANLKLIYSDLSEWNSLGLAFDVAGNYYDEDKMFSSSIIFKNIGRQITTFDGVIEPLPFNIQMAFSKRLSKGPFRFHVILNHLNKWNLFYEDIYDTDYIPDSFTGEINGKSKVEIFQENLLRHIIVGLEILPTKSFSLQVSYNYLQRQELKVSSRPGLTGFSVGFGLKIKKFQFNYARSQYHIHSSPNLISIATKF